MKFMMPFSIDDTMKVEENRLLVYKGEKGGAQELCAYLYKVRCGFHARAEEFWGTFVLILYSVLGSWTAGY